MLGQDIVETTVVKSEGVSTKKVHLEQSLFSIACSANDTELRLYPFSIAVKLEVPTSFPERLSKALLKFESLESFEMKSSNELNDRPQKRSKLSANGDKKTDKPEDIMYEVEVLSQFISSTISEDLNECL